MGRTRLWFAVCLLALATTVGAMVAGMRRVFETGSVSAGNGHYMVASMVAVVLFVALAGMDHGDDSDTNAREGD